MARTSGTRPTRRRQWTTRKRHCRFCAAPGAQVIDYKNVPLLQGFLDERSRIRKARRAGICRLHQSQLAREIKRSREIALLPYTRD